MMMIPEAYQDRDDLPEDLLGFYAFHSCMMEPWDGPAAVAFTDGRIIGATLDRNGLRPGRWLETEDGWVVLGSESGVMDEAAANVKRKGRLQPGKLFLVDLERGVIVDDSEVKAEVAGAAPYAQVVRGRHRAPRRPAAPARRRTRRRIRCTTASAPSASPRRTCGSCWRRPRPRPRSRSARWATTPRWRCSQRPAAAAVQLLQAALRAGHQPADRPDPRGDRDERRHRRRLGAQPALRGARARASALDADADPVRPRAAAAAPRRLVGLQGPHRRHHVADRRGPRRHGRPRSSACARRPTRRWPKASTS